MATHDYGEMCNGLPTLWEDGERVFSRAQWPADGVGGTRLIARPAVTSPHRPASIGSLTNSN